MSKLCRNQRGDIVLSTLIAFGISAIVLAGVVSGIISLYKMQKSADLSSEQKTATKALNQMLSVKQVCRDAFLNKNISSSIANPNNQNYMTDMSGGQVIMNGQVLTLGAANSEISPGVQLSKIDYLQVSNSAVVMSLPSGAGFASMNVYQGKLVLGTKKANEDLFFKIYKDVELPIEVAVDGSGQVQWCATTDEEGELCTSMNGQWHPLAAEGLRCITKNSCVFAGSYADPSAPASEGGFNNIYTNARSCPAGFSARKKGSIAYSYSCGKNCVENRYYPTYECSACVDANGQQLTANSPVYNPSGNQLNIDDVDEAFNSANDWYNSLKGAIKGAVSSIP